MAGYIRLLLIENDFELRSSLCRFLELADPRFHVVAAGSAEEAFQIMVGLNVDVVVSDLKLPGRDGLAFLQEVAQRAPGTRRILITGYPATPEFRQAVHEGGVEGFLVKPFEPEAFLALLQCVASPRSETPLGRIPPNP